MSWVVVLYSLGQCEQNESDRCLQGGAYGPFGSNEEAKRYAATMPSAFNAHTLLISDPLP